MSGTAASLGEAEFLAALLALLPRGAAWPRDPDTVLAQALSGLAATHARLHARAGDLSEIESDPAQATELLAAWEATYGLPDPCVPDEQTLQARRAALVSRIGQRGGQSRQYFIDVAAALGFAITIEEFRPLDVDHFEADDPVLDEPWAHAWRVRAEETTVVEFRAELSAADEPLLDFGNAALECVLGRLRPAHTVLQFAYGSA
jgi:uncharacterized protein YmfQ (DUF2313 family)